MVARQNDSIKSLRTFGVSLGFPFDGYVSGIFGRTFCQIDFIDGKPEFCFFLQEEVAFTVWDSFFSNTNVHHNGGDYKTDAV